MEKRPISQSNIALMLLLITLWGSSNVVVKITLREGLSPIAIATFRFLLAGGLFVIVLFANRIRNPGFRIRVEKNDAPYLIVLAFSGVTLYFAIYFTGIQMASASVAAILTCLLSPILISLLSAYMFKESLSKGQLLGSGIASIGTLAVVIGGTLNLERSMTFLLGSIMLLFTPVLWAAYTLLGKKMMEKYDPFLIVAYVNILGGLFLVPLSLAEHSFNNIFALNGQEWLAILYMASMCSVLGYFIWFHVIKRSSTVAASSFLFAEPLVTVLFATTLASEQVTSFTVAGGLMIFVGVLLVTSKRSAVGSLGAR